MMFARCIVIILTMILIVFLIAYLHSSVLPDMILIFSVLIFSCIVLPVAIMSISLIIWIRLQKKKNKVFEIVEMNKIGFIDKEINEEEFWKLIEHIKTRNVDGYIINANLSDTYSNQLELTIPLKWRRVNKHEFTALENEFTSQNIKLEIGYIVKQFCIKTLLANRDSVTFNKHILDFVRLVKQKGFEPE